MRRIEFRGKRVDNNEWAYGSLVYGSKIVKDEQGLNRIEDCPFIVFMFCDCVKSYAEVKPETVEQFTGLFDKNNNDIYEGDIVTMGGEKYTIVWGTDGNAQGYTVQGWGCKHTAEFMGTMTLRTKQNESLEIIGNIYDNPDLLSEVSNA